MRWAGVCLTLAALTAPVSAYEADQRFIFISSPSKRSIYYAPLPSFTELSKYSEDRLVQKAQVLIDGVPSRAASTVAASTVAASASIAAPTDAATLAASVDAAASADAGDAAAASGEAAPEQADKGSLVYPEGLAMWHGKDKAVLYVADSAANRIVAYQIVGTLDLDPATPMKFGTIEAGAQQIVAKNINSVSGLALDGFGNLYFSTTDGTVGMLPADQLNKDEPAKTILYSSDAQKMVSSPGSIAADNFNVYWANQVNGQQDGAVVSAFERNAVELAKKYPDFPKALAKNAVKAMGVCLARSNVFFTGEAQLLYGVNSAGGQVTEVYRNFQSPKGCVYDGEGSLYVADSKAGAVYSLPANFPTIRPVKNVQKVAIVHGPSSVAVFSRAPAYVMQSQDKGFLGLGW